MDLQLAQSFFLTSIGSAQFENAIKELEQKARMEKDDMWKDLNESYQKVRPVFSHFDLVFDPHPLEHGFVSMMCAHISAEKICWFHNKMLTYC